MGIVDKSALTPCIRQCKVDGGMCVSCGRTLTEIKEWKEMPDDVRMKLMKELQNRTSTHSCPECGSLAYCAMQDGKSGSACWCMGEVISSTLPAIEGAQCVCKTCLAKTCLAKTCLTTPDN